MVAVSGVGMISFSVCIDGRLTVQYRTGTKIGQPILVCDPPVGRH